MKVALGELGCSLPVPLIGKMIDKIGANYVVYDQLCSFAYRVYSSYLYHR